MSRGRELAKRARAGLDARDEEIRRRYEEAERDAVAREDELASGDRTSRRVVFAIGVTVQMGAVGLAFASGLDGYLVCAISCWVWLMMPRELREWS